MKKIGKLLLGIGIIAMLLVSAIGMLILHDLSIYPWDKIALDPSRINQAGYYKDRFNSNSIYYGFSGSSFGLMEYHKIDIDTGDYEILNPNYIKNNNKIYYGYQLIKDADPATFQTLPKASLFYIKDLGNNYDSGQNLRYKEINSKDRTKDIERNEDELAMDKNYIYNAGYAVLKNQFKKVTMVTENQFTADNYVFDIAYLNLSDGPSEVQLKNNLDSGKIINVDQITGARAISTNLWEINKSLFCFYTNDFLGDINPEKLVYTGSGNYAPTSDFKPEYTMVFTSGASKIYEKWCYVEKAPTPE